MKGKGIMEMTQEEVKKVLAEGISKLPSMGFIDKEMKKQFGDDILLTKCWGSVQMCVFEMDYLHIPTGRTILFDCERGFVVVRIINEYQMYSALNSVYPEANYYHYEDREEDLKQYIKLSYRAVNDKEFVFEHKGGCKV